MSFTKEVKNKIIPKEYECNFCYIAELAGLVRFASNLSQGAFTISTETETVARRCAHLLFECFGKKVEIFFDSKKKLYKISLDYDLENIVKCELCLDRDAIKLMPFECCRQSFITGAFLSGATVSNPEKSYHIEFDTKKSLYAHEVAAVLNNLGINAGITEKKGIYVVYIKDFNSVVLTLNKIGAGFAALKMYNISVEKEIRNEVNRVVNCENANMKKLAKASSLHLKAINTIKNTIGLDSLNDSLKEIAKVRLEYPEDSLKELGERLIVPIGKSGVNHRLKKIVEIADGLKKK